MYLGFEYSTISGASIGVNDFEIPDDKDIIISNAENEVQNIEATI
jgi:DNA-directed RNA polymerase subunit beta'